MTKSRSIFKLFLLFFALCSGNMNAAPSYWEKGINFFKEHPYLSAGAAIGIGAGIYGYKLFSKAKIDAMAREAARKIADERARQEFQKKQKAEEATRKLQAALDSAETQEGLRKSSSVLQCYLEDGADPNIVGDYGSVLHLLARRHKDFGSYHLLKDLVSRKLNLNIVDFIGNTPLNCAAEHGNWNELLFLLEHQANPNIQAHNGMTPLINAIRVATYMSNYIEVYVQIRLDELVEALLLNGADPNIQAHKAYKENSALHYAVESDSNKKNVTHALYKTIALLLKHGADIAVKNSDGLTALDIARAKNKQEIVDLLTNYHAGKNFKAIENDAQSYVSLLPKDLKNMTSNYILPK